MVALFVAQLEAPTRRLISSVLLIAGGTAMASYGEVNMSAMGLIFMFSSEAFEAIRLVMTQMLLVGHKFHPSAAPCWLPGCGPLQGCVSRGCTRASTPAECTRSCTVRLKRTRYKVLALMIQASASGL